jgi:hypothetical protein
MSNAGPRIRGLADDLQETVADVAAELARDGLTAVETCLIERLRHLGARMEFEVSVEDYAASLRSSDPFGRRMTRERRDLEGTYRIALPPLPNRVQALDAGDD